MKYTSRSVEETAELAEKWLHSLQPAKPLKPIKPAKRSEATAVGLYGDLGSGKTAFSQAVAKILGIVETVTSPTFTIEKIYSIGQNAAGIYKSTPYTHLIHIDAYRLENSEEMLRLGWKEILSNPANLILVEWPEKVADIMPPDHIRLDFTFIDETTREISWREDGTETDMENKVAL